MLTHPSALETPVYSPEEAKALREHRLRVYTNCTEDHVVHRLWGRSDNGTRDLSSPKFNLDDFLNTIDDRLRPSST